MLPSLRVRANRSSLDMRCCDTSAASPWTPAACSRRRAPCLQRHCQCSAWQARCCLPTHARGGKAQAQARVASQLHRPAAHQHMPTRAGTPSVLDAQAGCTHSRHGTIALAQKGSKPSGGSGRGQASPKQRRGKGGSASKQRPSSQQNQQQRQPRNPKSSGATGVSASDFPNVTGAQTAVNTKVLTPSAPAAEPWWSTFVGHTAGVWCGRQAAFALHSAELEAVGVDAKGNVLPEAYSISEDSVCAHVHMLCKVLSTSSDIATLHNVQHAPSCIQHLGQNSALPCAQLQLC